MTKSKSILKALNFMLVAMKRRRFKMTRKTSEGFGRCYRNPGMRLFLKEYFAFGPGYIAQIDRCTNCRIESECPNKLEYVIIPTKDEPPSKSARVMRSELNPRITYVEFMNPVQEMIRQNPQVLRPRQPRRPRREDD